MRLTAAVVAMAFASVAISVSGEGGLASIFKQAPTFSLLITSKDKDESGMRLSTD